MWNFLASKKAARLKSAALFGRTVRTKAGPVTHQATAKYRNKLLVNYGHERLAQY